MILPISVLLLDDVFEPPATPTLEVSSLDVDETLVGGEFGLRKGPGGGGGGIAAHSSNVDLALVEINVHVEAASAVNDSIFTGCNGNLATADDVDGILAAAATAAAAALAADAEAAA